VPIMAAELGSHVTQCAWAEAHLSTKYNLDPSSRFATTDMGQKVGAAVPQLITSGLSSDATPACMCVCAWMAAHQN